MKSDLVFHQLFEKESSTYTYLLGDPTSGEAVIIDPVLETVERDASLIQELGLKLKYILETHVHADHITGAGELRKRFGGKIVLSSMYEVSCGDVRASHGEVFTFGPYALKVIHTPGHTSGCLSYLLGSMLFTGDALLVRGCGRTDFQGGSAEKLFESVREKLFTLPDETEVYPAHDYKGFTKTTIGTEKKLNPRLKLDVSKDQFLKIMAQLNLPFPKKIKEAVPANLQCGLH